MEASPLTQQERPSSFQPKIAQLYEDLFRQDDLDEALSDGFWRELFLLRPDTIRLQQRLERLSPTDLIHCQHESQQLFTQAVSRIKARARPDAENALDTLTVFLNVILAKRYTNPSADIINLMTGLDNVDTIFIDFATAIEATIRTGRTAGTRRKGIDTALALTSGAYQTSLVTYLTHQDLFPSLVQHARLDCGGSLIISRSLQFVRDTESKEAISRAFLLLGLLANYNKFEFRNPYRAHLEDFTNESIIQNLVLALGASLHDSRDRYVAIQEDIAEGWTLSSTLNYIGLGLLAPTRQPIPNPSNDPKRNFGDLPDHGVCVLLGGYEFASASKVFCHSLVSYREDSKTAEPPLSAFLSFTSYLLHHAYRSSRATTYGLLSLFIIRNMIEDAALCKVLCDPEIHLSVRFCRQRQPFLPPTIKPRPPAASILDVAVDTINHNLRRHLDLELYITTVDLLHRLISFLALNRTRLAYHWSLLWQTMISFLRFMTTYSSSFASSDPDLPRLVKPLLNTLALVTISGESFLPDPSAYDDLFYKLVEASDVLDRFKSAFAAHIEYESDPSSASDSNTTAIDLLIHVSMHYQDLVQEEREKGRLGNNPSPRQISKIIRQGYESLRLPGMEGLSKRDHFREGEHRGLLKRAARIAADDTRQLLAS